jgi:hypothetical protein
MGYKKEKTMKKETMPIAPMTKPFKETVLKRLEKDEEFRKGLEQEIITAIEAENYYLAHIMLRDLVEYKEILIESKKIRGEQTPVQISGRK